jgi:hypothetical protein
MSTHIKAVGRTLKEFSALIGGLPRLGEELDSFEKDLELIWKAQPPLETDWLNFVCRPESEKVEVMPLSTWRILPHWIRGIPPIDLPLQQHLQYGRSDPETLPEFPRGGREDTRHRWRGCRCLRRVHRTSPARTCEKLCLRDLSASCMKRVCNS